MLRGTLSLLFRRQTVRGFSTSTYKAVDNVAKKAAETIKGPTKVNLQTPKEAVKDTANVVKEEIKKPVVEFKPKHTNTTINVKYGGIKGGIVGFIFGITLSGISTYYGVVQNFDESKSVVIGDVLKLQQSIYNLEKHISKLEAKLKEEKK